MRKHDCGLSKEFVTTVNVGHGKAIVLPVVFFDEEIVAMYYENASDVIGWWIGNGIYQSKIRFCPYCGLDLYISYNE